jgi:hypothetical protein
MSGLFQFFKLTALTFNQGGGGGTFTRNYGLLAHGPLTTLMKSATPKQSKAARMSSAMTMGGRTSNHAASNAIGANDGTNRRVNV